jgi:mannose-1-phosphate guanylyltransferase
MLHALIMAGGGGTRFWPRSRQKRPKQFLKLTGAATLLQQAVARIEAQVPPERTWIITGADFQDETARQVPVLARERIIGEPCGRDTAACIALGAALIARSDPEAIMLVMPADHVIEPAQEFARAVHVAEHMARESPASLITFGIRPTGPATGYGYIHRGPEIAHRQGVRVFRVQGFREKPNQETAERMIASGEFFWNSGIFAWTAAAILKELRNNRPAIHAAALRIAEAWGSPRGDQVFRDEYAALEKISIDFAVMEKARDVLVVEAPFRWDDVGSWLALERLHPQDADGNTVLARHCGVKTKNCIVAADADRLVATVGVEDLVIIQEGNAILVAHRRDEAGIRQIVETLKAKGMADFL